MQTWLVKLDEADNGIGIAEVNTQLVPGLREALKASQDAAAQFLQQCGARSPQIVKIWPQASKISFSEAQIAHLEEMRLGSEHAICQCLLRGLPRALQAAAPNAFPSYRAFVKVRPANMLLD